MKKEDFIKLTNNLYSLTQLFPKKEPLRYKTREIADEILANFLKIPNPSRITEDCPPQILGNLEVLDSFFEVAKGQNWVSPSAILEIQREYSKIKEELKKEDSPRTVFEDRQGRGEGVEIEKNLRQKKILEILREKGKAQVWELKKIFPEVSKRTLRRDFEQLLRQSLIERKGERNNTFYCLRVGQPEG